MLEQHGAWPPPSDDSLYDGLGAAQRQASNGRGAYHGSTEASVVVGVTGGRQQGQHVASG